MISRASMIRIAGLACWSAAADGLWLCSNEQRPRGQGAAEARPFHGDRRFSAGPTGQILRRWGVQAASRSRGVVRQLSVQPCEYDHQCGPRHAGDVRTPYKHGLSGNNWIVNRKTKEWTYSTEDARHKYLDEGTPPHSGTSPYNIKVTAVGDELIYAHSQSKVIAISGKDRSAIGLAGHFGTAYIHNTTTGRFITSDYYTKDYPDIDPGEW
jgi:hypothetical protein